MRYDRRVLGYHGCTREVAIGILADTPFQTSANDFDWLGKGIYFWEYGPDRAMRFIREKLARENRKDEPAVVGAILQLGTCFDLLDTENTAALAEVYPAFVETLEAVGDDLPRNAGRTSDLKLRRLDCAVLNWYLDLAQDYQTVRGCFVEGGPAFPGSGLQAEAHIQIAVRDPGCIIGTFRPTLRS